MIGRRGLASPARFASADLHRWRHIKRWAGIALLIAVGVADAQPADQAPFAKSVEIRSDWSGLSPDSPLQIILTLTRVGDHYEVIGRSVRAGRTTALALPDVSPASVNKLVTAMRQPAQAVFAIADLGVPAQAIQSRIDSEFKDANLLNTGTVRAYRVSLREPDTVASVLTNGFRSFHTDDYPRIQVDVELSDGASLVAESRSQQFLMLPWRFQGGTPTYSSALSLALWQILPDGSTNKERLHGPVEPADLDELVSAALFDQLNRFRAEAHAGGALRVLEENFGVDQPRVQDPVPSIPLGKVLFASLRLPDGPTRLKMNVRLPLKGYALQRPTEDVARIRAALLAAKSSPGLMAAIEADPAADFDMNDRFGWSWLNDEATKQFVQQMQEMHKLPDLLTDQSLMRGAVMVEEGTAPRYWVVLSDHRAVLWKEYTSDAASPGTMRCASMPNPDDDDLGMDSLGGDDDLCIGRVYSADGREVPDAQ